MEQPQHPTNQTAVPPRHQVEGQSKKQWQCDRCGKVFRSASAIAAHIEVVHNGVKCTCEVCGATMKWKYNLKNHMRNKHNIGDPPIRKTKNRKCQRCGIVFTSNSLLNDHIRTVHKERPYRCDLCSETFWLAAELSTHKLYHPELVMYTCSVCTMRYRTKLGMEMHIEKTGHEQTTSQDNEVAESTKYDQDLEKAGHRRTTNQDNEVAESTKYDQDLEKAGHRRTTNQDNEVAESTKNDQDLEKAGHRQTTTQENVVVSENKKNVQGVEKTDHQQATIQENEVISESQENGQGLAKVGHEQTPQENVVISEIQEDDQGLAKDGHEQTPQENVVISESQENGQGLAKDGHQQTPQENVVISESQEDDQGLAKDGHQQTPRENAVLESKKKHPGFVCPKCNWQFLQYQAFRTHVNNIKGCQLKLRLSNRSDTRCRCCPKVFDTRRDMKDHLHAVHRIKMLDKATGKYVYRYPCSVCNKLVNLWGLGYHLKMHGGAREYACDQCDYKCIFKSDLRKHQVRHRAQKRFQCRFCSREFNLKRELADHESRLHLHIVVQPFQCTVCQRQFDNRQYGFKHQNMCKRGLQHEPEPECKQTKKTSNSFGFRCMLCSAVFGTKAALTIHRNKSHVQVAAEKTSLKLNSKQSRLENENARDGGKVLEPKYHPSCPFCWEVFSNLGALVKHEKECIDRKIARKASGSESSEGDTDDNGSNDGLGQRGEKSGTKGSSESAKTKGIKDQRDQECKGLKRKYPTTDQEAPNMSCINYCSTCGKSTVEMIRQVCPSHQVTCSFCKKVFKSDPDLEAHLTRVHLNEHEKPNSSSNTCSTCGKTTQELVHHHLAKHFNRDDSATRVPRQSHCKRSTNDTAKSVIQVHVQHKQPPSKCKTYQCSFCKDSFCIERNLRVHMRTHKDVLPFPCSYCIMSYGTGLALQSHMKDKHMDIWKLLRDSQ